MDKPTRLTLTAYDYNACRAYLQARDGYDERDYAGRFSTGDRTRPYQDFWHFLCDRAPELHNGSFLTLCEWWKEGAEPWQQEILDKYLTTFGVRDPATGERCVTLYVSW